LLSPFFSLSNLIIHLKIPIFCRRKRRERKMSRGGDESDWGRDEEDDFVEDEKDEVRWVDKQVLAYSLPLTVVLSLKNTKSMHVRANRYKHTFEKSNPVCTNYNLIHQYITQYLSFATSHCFLREMEFDTSHKGKARVDQSSPIWDSLSIDEKTLVMESLSGEGEKGGYKGGKIRWDDQERIFRLGKLSLTIYSFGKFTRSWKHAHSYLLSKLEILLHFLIKEIIDWRHEQVFVGLLRELDLISIFLNASSPSSNPSNQTSAQKKKRRTVSIDAIEESLNEVIENEEGEEVGDVEDQFDIESIPPQFRIRLPSSSYYHPIIEPIVNDQSLSDEEKDEMIKEEVKRTLRDIICDRDLNKYLIKHRIFFVMNQVLHFFSSSSNFNASIIIRADLHPLQQVILRFLLELEGIFGEEYEFLDGEGIYLAKRKLLCPLFLSPISYPFHPLCGLNNGRNSMADNQHLINQVLTTSLMGSEEEGLEVEKNDESKEGKEREDENEDEREVKFKYFISDQLNESYYFPKSHKKNIKSHVFPKLIASSSMYFYYLGLEILKLASSVSSQFSFNIDGNQGIDPSCSISYDPTLPTHISGLCSVLTNIFTSHIPPPKPNQQFPITNKNEEDRQQQESNQPFHSFSPQDSEDNKPPPPSSHTSHLLTSLPFQTIIKVKPFGSCCNGFGVRRSATSDGSEEQEEEEEEREEEERVVDTIGGVESSDVDLCVMICPEGGNDGDEGLLPIPTTLKRSLIQEISNILIQFSIDNNVQNNIIEEDEKEDKMENQHHKMKGRFFVRDLLTRPYARIPILMFEVFIPSTVDSTTSSSKNDPSIEVVQGIEGRWISVDLSGC